MPVPARLRTARLLLRPWRAEDAASLRPVLESNQAHLGPWIPARVAQPAPLQALAKRLAGFADDFTAAREWRYGMFTPDEAAVIGEVGLYPRDPHGRVPFTAADRVELGYWLRQDRTGQGLVTEAAQALLAVVRALPSLAHAEIRCDARNAPSAAVPQRLGFALALTEEQPGAAPGEPPVMLEVWALSLGGHVVVYV
ncbi:MAG: GNAT family N-acetyltransferase [Gemmatimonadaceae bacterium]